MRRRIIEKQSSADRTENKKRYRSVLATACAAAVLFAAGCGSYGYETTESSAENSSEYAADDVQTEEEDQEKLLYSGTSGDLEWKLDQYGVLTISGSGDYEDDGKSEDGAYPAWTDHYLFILNAVVEVDDITSTEGMFYGCKYLREADLSGLDTSEVTNMEYMFCNCWDLTSLDLSGFDTSRVTSMDYMFAGCSGLTDLDLSSFDTSGVVSVENMFAGCPCLTNLTAPDDLTQEAEQHRNDEFMSATE